MNTKEAIKFLNRVLNWETMSGEINKNIPMIISLLQEGEENKKYKQIVNEWAWWALFVVGVIMGILVILKY